MLINWFTVVAQVINFLILVWLLKRFLYKPILNAIEDREKMIASQLREAEKKEQDASRDKEEYKRKNEEFDRERAAAVNQMIGETRTQRQQLLEEARKESGLLRDKLAATLREEQENINHRILARTKSEVFAIARKALKELADTELEGQMVKAFIARLNRLSNEERQQWIATLKTDHSPLVVRSTVDLPQPLRGEIERVVQNILGVPSTIQFETSEDLVSGIEMLSNGYKVEWSLSEYLTDVQKAMDELMTATTAVSDTKENGNA